MNKTTRHLTLFAILLLHGIAASLQAQDYSIDYIGELQTGFRRAHSHADGSKEDAMNFANQLRLAAEMPLGKGFSVEASTVSFLKTSRNPLLPMDLQVFSNIEADNLPIALCTAGFQWEHTSGKGLAHTVFAGVRNMNEDYFTSEVMGLFTNSSCGIFPTIAANSPIANYPMASMGLHYNLALPITSDKLTTFILNASLYNGTGYNRFAGRDNVFRICPHSDGVFTLAEAQVEHNDSRYYLGTSLRTASGDHSAFTLWTYAEQKVVPHLWLTAAYSRAMGNEADCHNFAAIGARLLARWGELGLFSDVAHCKHETEWATELTARIPVHEYLSLQPALHLVKNPSGTHPVGLLRLIVSI